MDVENAKLFVSFQDVKFLNMNKVINIREPVATPAPATRQSSIHSSKVRLQKHKPTASTSTKTVQLKRSPYLEQTHEATGKLYFSPPIKCALFYEIVIY